MLQFKSNPELLNRYMKKRRHEDILSICGMFLMSAVIFTSSIILELPIIFSLIALCFFLMFVYNFFDRCVPMPQDGTISATVCATITSITFSDKLSEGNNVIVHNENIDHISVRNNCIIIIGKSKGDVIVDSTIKLRRVALPMVFEDNDAVLTILQGLCA